MLNPQIINTMFPKSMHTKVRSLVFYADDREYFLFTYKCNDHNPRNELNLHLLYP